MLSSKIRNLSFISIVALAPILVFTSCLNQVSISGAASASATSLSSSSCRKNAIATVRNPNATLPLPSHPRILLNSSVVERARILLAIGDSKALSMYASLLSSANAALNFPVYVCPSTGAAEGDARGIQQRIASTAGAFLLTNDPIYSARAIQEMEGAAACSNWNPPYFLATAEMTQAFAIGYDWLYSVLTPAQKSTIGGAITNLGLLPGLSLYPTNNFWPANTGSNWTAVCNGGLLNGALAVFDEQPAIAAQILPYAKKGLAAVSKMYGPDGGWIEGPGYYDYASKYFMYSIASLMTSLGDDWGLASTPGLSETAYFAMYVNSHNGSFNYADNNSEQSNGSFMMFLARQFNLPMAASYQIPNEINPHALDYSGILGTFWYDPGCVDSTTKISTDRLFQGIGTSFFRASWIDPNAFAIGFKGGSNDASHAHMDLGHFIFDALGHRWAIDYGDDDYSLPSYFNTSKRIVYYRLKTEGHNTLTISNTVQVPLNFGNQDPFASASVIAYASNPSVLSYSVVDLSSAYPVVVSPIRPAPSSPPAASLVTRAQRGMALIQNNLVLIRDEVVAPLPVDVVWNMHTGANIAIDSSRTVATLTISDESMLVQINSPSNGYFEVVTDDPGAPQNTNTGLYNLVIRIPEMTTNVTFEVILKASGNMANPTLGPLSNWITMAQ